MDPLKELQRIAEEAEFHPDTRRMVADLARAVLAAMKPAAPAAAPAAPAA